LSVFESLKSHAGILASGALSFIVVVGGMRLTGGEPLVEPQTDVGILIGVAMVALFFVINDTCGGVRR
jgi:hypothetical protein